MIDYKKTITIIVFGILFWIGGSIAKELFPSYYRIIILIVIPVGLGLLFSFILRNSSKRNVIIYSAMSVIVRDIIIAIKTISLFLGDEFFIKYLKEIFVSFLYVSPIQLFFIAITWILASLVIKRKEKA